MLYNEAGSLIVVGDALPELGNEGVEGQSFGVAVHGTDELGRCDDVDFAAEEHFEGVYGEFAF